MSEVRCEIYDMPTYMCAHCQGHVDTTTANVGSSRRRTESDMTKQELWDRICDLYGTDRYKLGNGSTEPVSMLNALLDAAGLPRTGDKPAKARALAEARGVDWPKTGDSSDTESRGGGTIATSGVLAVLRSAEDWARENNPEAL